MITTRINTPDTEHLYEIETEEEGTPIIVEVEANNRNQAARIAREHGYAVRSVNMTG